LGEVTLALTCLPEDFISEAQFQIGKATMEPAFYGPIVPALHERPRRVSELIALPEVVGRRDNPAELIAMLVGTDQAVPVTPRPAAPADPAARFNRVSAEHIIRQDLLTARFALASARLGVGLNAMGLELLVFTKLQDNPELSDPEPWIREIVANRDEADAAKLRETFTRILEHRVPLWRRLGIAP